MKKISIVIPTYNRCESLRDTLKNLCEQELQSDYDMEIIVVNNNSTDNTPRVVDEVKSSTSKKIRHILEPLQGVSLARNRGIEESQGEYIFFIDDDVLPHPGWITAIMKAFQVYQADCVAGKIVPKWEVDPPSWVSQPELKSTLRGVFALLDHGPEAFIMTELDYNFLYGANMAFLKNTLIEAKGFREDLGLKGNKRSYGEETDLMIRLFNNGKKMVYSPEVVVSHKVPANRMRLSYVRKWRYDKGRDTAENGRIPPFWLIKECLFNAFFALRDYAKNKKILAIQEELRFWNQFGQISGMCQKFFTKSKKQ